MFRPENPESPAYPVFMKVDGRIFPFVSLPGAIAVFLVLALCWGLNHIAGSWMHEVVVQRTDEDMARDLASLELARDIVSFDETLGRIDALEEKGGKDLIGLTEDELADYYELQADKTLYSAKVNSHLSAEIRDARELAERFSITPVTVDEELRALVELTETQEARVVGALPTVITCVILLGITVSFVFEPTEGKSLWKMVRANRAFRRKQHIYSYHRLVSVRASAKEEF